MFGKCLNAMRGRARPEFYIAIVLIAILAIGLLNGCPDIFDSQKSELESRMEHILSSINGIKDIEVMITTDKAGMVGGIVVVADGIEDLKAYLSVQNAIRTLLNTDLSKIHIIAQK